MSTLSDGVVNADVTSVQIQPSRLFFRIYCILYVLEVHEAKSSRSSSLMIVYDLKVLDLSISLKDLTQVSLLGAEVETKDAKATAFPWIVFVSLMTATVRQWRSSVSTYSFSLVTTTVRHWGTFFLILI